ncbi:MAG: YncE family protein [Alphaproteobacteria bacterium]
MISLFAVSVKLFTRRLQPRLIIGLVSVLLAAPAAEAKDLLWQTNSGGDDIHIYDIETGKLVRRLVVGDHPHGIDTAPGSATVFISLERNGRPHGELLWINKHSFKIEHRLKVGRQPHAIAVTPDGRWIYVPCRDGHYWVIDGRRRKVTAKIRTGGRPHNTTAEPDGKFMYLSPMGGPERVTIAAPQRGHKVVGEIRFSDSVRPAAIAPSRHLFFQQVDGLNGFEVASLSRRERIARVEHSGSLGLRIWPESIGFLGWSGLNRCHGLAVRPGDREIWSVCAGRVTIHSIDSRAFTQLAQFKLPGKGYWLTFSPNGRFAFIALSKRSEVAMVDARTRKLVRRFPAGQSPKRNLVIPARR